MLMSFIAALIESHTAVSFAACATRISILEPSSHVIVFANHILIATVLKNAAHHIQIVQQTSRWLSSSITDYSVAGRASRVFTNAISTLKRTW
jgi:hypothetical protein